MKYPNIYVYAGTSTEIYKTGFRSVATRRMQRGDRFASTNVSSSPLEAIDVLKNLYLGIIAIEL